MSRNNTGNPVPSSDPRDRQDNSLALDEAVNSESTTFNDRTGKSRLTIKGMEQVFDGGQPAIDAFYSAQEEANRSKSEADRSKVEADRADTAADVAQLSTSVYQDTTAGIGATVDGEYFSVPSAENSEYLILYRNNAGTAQEIKRYPSAAIISDIYQSDLYSFWSKDDYRERYALADLSEITVENIQDTASVTTTLSKVPDGLKVDLETARTIAVSLPNTMGNAKARIKMTAEATYSGSACLVGIGMTDGVDTWDLRVRTNGWLTYGNSRGTESTGIISQDLYQYLSGDTIEIDLVVDPETESAQVEIYVADRAPFVIGLRNLPMGQLQFIQDENGSSVVYSLDVSAVKDFEAGTLSAEPALSDQQKGDLIAVSAFMDGYKRKFPDGFAGRYEDYLTLYFQPVSGQYIINYKPNDLLSEDDPEVAKIYVDIATGDDQNRGSETSPIKSILTALIRLLENAKAMVIVKGGLYPHDFCWRAGVSGKNIQLLVKSWDGQPVISSSHDDTLAWTLESDDTYSATSSKVLRNVADAANLTADGDYSLLELAADLATCKATPGTHFIDGSVVYVHTIDNREPDADIRVYVTEISTSLGNGRFNSEGGKLQMENIHFEGGRYAFRGALPNSGIPATVYGKGCSFKYASGGSSPVVNGKYTAIWDECVAAWNQGDGFHYNPISGSVPADGIEINCISRWNGVSAGGVGNNSSNHGGSTVRIKTKDGFGDYHHAEARGIHDIAESEDCLSWMLGITSRDSRNGYANFAIGLSSGANRGWLDGCSSSGASIDIEASNTETTVYISDFSGDAVNAGDGTITGYTP